MNYQDTKECVDSVLKQEYENFHIVVVDNGSTNESYNFLYKSYRKNLKVSIIRVHRNYGYAKGNNIGIRYARKKLEAEYILLLNNDTILESPLYIQKMLTEDEEGVGVIGSNIILKDNRRIKMICRHVTFPGTLLYYMEIWSERYGLYLLHDMFKKMVLKCQGTYILQGCVLLLTPQYFDYYDGLDDRTFLYCEEELLYLRCKEKGLSQKIVEDLVLLHKEGKSTEFLYNKRKFFTKYLLASYKYVLLESIKDYISKEDVRNR